MFTFFKLFKFAVVAFWVAGFFASQELRLLLWSMPAGYAAGTIIAGYFFSRSEVNLRAFGRGLRVKKIDLNEEDAPPELREAMKTIINFEMNKSGRYEEGEDGELKRKKCDNPHCPGCWGLADKEDNADEI